MNKKINTQKDFFINDTFIHEISHNDYFITTYATVESIDHDIILFSCKTNRLDGIYDDRGWCKMKWDRSTNTVYGNEHITGTADEVIYGIGSFVNDFFTVYPTIVYTDKGQNN
jgi:hypothetical protein